jgi:hypothetical protein
MLPTTKQTSKSPWNSFEDAKAAFDKIIPYETTQKEMQTLGFDPFTTPNIKILTYVDIMNRFMPNPSVKKEDLAEGVQFCIDAKADCIAYEFAPQVIDSKRYGNVFMDIFNFHRKSNETGWRFETLIVIIDDIIVYKLWGGNPVIDQYKETKNPLGPLQNTNDLIKVSPGL